MPGHTGIPHDEATLGVKRRARSYVLDLSKVVVLTLSQVIRAVTRQWVVVLIGLALTGIAAHQVAQAEQVYWTQTTVRFVPVADSPGIGGNTIVSNSESLIAFAGLVLADLKLGPAVDISGLGPNILDLGEDHGVWVRLPDGGGQWTNSFDEAFLDVQVSGPSAADVRRRTTQTIDAIHDATARRLGNLATASVAMRPVPPTPVVTAARGSSKLALLASLVLGLAGTIGVALAVDALTGDLRRRRAARKPAIQSARVPTD